MEFELDIPIRFGEVDPAGIVYYPRFFHYYHVAFEEFFGATHGVPYPQWIGEHRIGFPTVHVEADFARPLRYGDPLRVAVSVARLSLRSLDFRFEARVEADAVAWSVATKTCVDLDAFTPIPIPDELRTVFERYRGES